MTSSFTLPPAIRRFGRCGEDEKTFGLESSVQSPGELYHREHRYHSSHSGKESGTERVKSFVNGIVSPFTACWQPSVNSCVSSCAPGHAFKNPPAVVSPHVERTGSYHSSHFEHERKRYSHHYRSYTPRHVQHKYYPSPHYPDPLSPKGQARASSTRGEEYSRRHDGVDYDKVSREVLPYDESKRKTDIAKPQSNDILCGRGGSSNRHQGNIHFRELVAANKHIYVGLTKKQKMMVARKIVDAVHRTGGRFLAKDLDTGLFYDIGLPRSLEKTSQALREKHSNEVQVAAEESEGIETSVESHNKVVEIETQTDDDGEKQSAGESSIGVSSSPLKKVSKSSKVVEAPSLVIPPHLLKIFRPKGLKSTEGKGRGINQPIDSPGRYHYSDKLYETYPHPYPPSPYQMHPVTSPSHHHRTSYLPIPGHPSPPPSYAPHTHYMRSPIPTSSHYSSQQYTYCYGRPHHPSSGSPRCKGHEDRYEEPPCDDREFYHREYYVRSRDYDSTSSRSPQSGQYPPPNPLQYATHPEDCAPPTHHSLQHSTHPESPSPILPYRSCHRRHHYNDRTSPPSLPREASSNSKTIHRKASKGHVRENSDMSPVRQRELKRPRNDEGLNIIKIADASLSSAVKKSLTLDERVVGREREQERLQQKHQKQFDTHEATLDTRNRSRNADLVSPSTLLQSNARSRQLVPSVRAGGPAETKVDYSGLSGLAALSTAAFLKLDDDGGDKN